MTPQSRFAPVLPKPVGSQPRGPAKLYDVSSYVHALFDHHLTFRRKGTRGRLTWSNAVVVGMPYDGAWCGDPAAVSEASEWFLAAGVGLWTRRDLSSWYPGWTRLVIASPILREPGPLASLARAAEFGFTALTP
jgi:hypothetical protein